MSYMENYEQITKMQRNCKDCRYYQKSFPCCDYIDIEGHRRPCKAGDDCTVKEVGEYQEDRTIRPLKPVPRDEWELYHYGRTR